MVKIQKAATTGARMNNARTTPSILGVLAGGGLGTASPTMDGVKARSVVLYTVLRLHAFLVPFGIMMIFPLFREYYWLAAIFAALIGLSLSIVFLRRPLDDMTTGLAQRRAERQVGPTDEEIEDAELGSDDPEA